MSNYFTELAKINVSDHVEKKGKFSYLSWTFAVNELRKNHPDATWNVERFDGKPFMQTELGYFVEVSVTVNDIKLSQIHPVLDNRNNPIEKPSPFNINTSIQRCLVKAIALHGLGLYIYAGEDLPTEYELISSEQVGTIRKKALEFAKMRGRTEQDLYRSMSITDVTKLSSEQAKQVIKKIDGFIQTAQQEKGDTDDVQTDSEAEPQKTST